MKNMKTALILSALTAMAMVGIQPAMASGSNLDAAKIPQKQAQEMSLAFLQQGKAKPPIVASTPAPQAQIQMPPPEAMIIMVRASLVALSQANVTNNYTVLNQLGSNGFRQNNPPARLSEAFAPFRTNKIDLAPVVFVTPQLSQQPKIENGKLRMVGYFPTQPMRVDFDLQFEPSEGIWKLFGIAVDLSPAQQAAAPVAPQMRFVPGQGNQPAGR
jgi:hypothetical protein